MPADILNFSTSSLCAPTPHLSGFSSLSSGFGLASTGRGLALG